MSMDPICSRVLVKTCTWVVTLRGCHNRRLGALPETRPGLSTHLPFTIDPSLESHRSPESQDTMAQIFSILSEPGTATAPGLLKLIIYPLTKAKQSIQGFTIVGWVQWLGHVENSLVNHHLRLRDLGYEALGRDLHFFRIISWNFETTSPGSLFLNCPHPKPELYKRWWEDTDMSETDGGESD
ncbi:hypothetical protein DM02DRAFT_634225 [Periconia macrospinosa]|uniref:Uncharacterized protein n=1 Tax=Periconia macrospinosa TaxID=97972 RepID=A0A2V1D722_9PLEO|nr:hypothetical protein DM02DRAFT_634225 [Periconia macrospinosa]